MSAPAEFAATCRVFVVEDQGMFRAFLERWLATQPGFALAGTARTGEEALAALEAARPDVLLVDLQLPGVDGLGFVRAARQTRPQLRSLVLSSLMDPLALTRVRESGVEGYLEKDAPPAELGEALRAVARGREYFSARFRAALAAERANAAAVGKVLSRREQQVMSHVLEGKTSREIAEALGVSVRTVEFHRANVMTKLGATSVAELHAIARRSGTT
ncbi:MAG: response regulator transcription factor [Opitutae bacterium]|nr:response regulator transcription factor [Opitutae bacterium]